MQTGDREQMDRAGFDQCLPLIALNLLAYSQQDGRSQRSLLGRKVLPQHPIAMSAEFVQQALWSPDGATLLQLDTVRESGSYNGGKSITARMFGKIEFARIVGRRHFGNFADDPQSVPGVDAKQMAID